MKSYSGRKPTLWNIVLGEYLHVTTNHFWVWPNLSPVLFASPWTSRICQGRNSIVLTVWTVHCRIVFTLDAPNSRGSRSRSSPLTMQPRCLQRRQYTLASALLSKLCADGKLQGLQTGVSAQAFQDLLSQVRKGADKESFCYKLNRCIFANCRFGSRAVV